MTAGRQGAAGIIVGNEVLTAKVADSNGPYLIRKLRERAIPLLGLCVVPDEVDAIVEAVVSARRRASWVVTSGGIGPTHDDVTVRGVALALGRRVVRLPAMIDIIKAAWKGEEPPPAALRLAEAPEGAELLPLPGTHFPVLACDGVFMLPGVPRYFEAQLDVVLTRLPAGTVALKVLYLSATEPEIARALDGVAMAMPHVAFGSYPRVGPEVDWRVKVTIEHEQPEPVAEALTRLVAALPAGCLLRVE